MLRVALWCVLLAAVTRTSADPDLWGNVRFGLDILRDGAVPLTDTYSFTTDRAGNFLIACAVPGHAAAGMYLKLVVSPGVDKPEFR